MLEFPNPQFERAKNIKFGYPDMQGSLKVIVINQLGISPSSNSKMKILNLADGLDKDAYEDIYEQWTCCFIHFHSLSFVLSKLDFVDTFWQKVKFANDVEYDILHFCNKPHFCEYCAFAFACQKT